MVTKSYREKQSWEVGGRQVAINTVEWSKLEGLINKMIYDQRSERVREQPHHAGIYRGNQRGNKCKGIT